MKDRSFSDDAQTQMAIKKEKQWSRYYCNKGHDGIKVHYRCNQVKFRGKQCDAAIYLHYPNDSDPSDGVEKITESTFKPEVLIVDGSGAIRNVFTQIFNNDKTMMCWAHMRRNMNKKLNTIRDHDRYNEEKLRREKLEEELQKANDQLGQFPNQRPSTQIERPGEPPFPTRPSRPIPTTDIYLPEYCPSLVERLKDNPKVLTKYRDEARRQFVDELEDYENLGISDTDTRLTDLDFRTKMESILQTRRNIQDDLPNFERIRANLTRILDKNINERSDVRRSITSIRSTGSKLVTFEDEHQRSKYDNIKKNLTDQRGAVTTTIQSKPKYDHSRPTIKNESDDDITISNANESDDDTQPTRPGITSDIQPPPRKHVPPSKTQNGISSLVAVSMRPTTTTNQTTTISARPRQQIVKPISTTTNKSNSDSESENAVPSPSTAGPYSMNVTEKKRLIEQKLHEASKKGEKPTINAIAQGFRPSRESLATQHDDDDNDQSESFTTLHTNPAQKPLNGHLPQLSPSSVRTQARDISQHTYDSLWKSQAGKGAELRRPLTADSAKTSILDSDDNQDEGESN
ncbi:unnamed protein product [Rotaria sordida]|uniref:Cilium assembly protein DZIP1 domain-containing protein n=1 Tax=Rotaria sordida TaxID=392033 RepID=A0A813VE11_9BILA|nr:unnamed protein product [Rotaria sordida]